MVIGNDINLANISKMLTGLLLIELGKQTGDID